MNKRIKKIINVAILVLIVIFSSVGCSSDSKYSDLLTKYIEINNDYIVFLIHLLHLDSAPSQVINQ